MDILLVEDHPADRRILEVLAGDMETPVHLEPAGSLREAIDLAATGAFDLVLLDLGLPDSLGIQTLERFRQSVPEVPVVVVSGMGDPDTGLEAVRLGAVNYLVKGRFDGDLLEQTLLNALERVQIQEDLERQAAKVRLVDEPRPGTVRLFTHEDGVAAVTTLSQDHPGRPLVVVAVDQVASSLRKGLKGHEGEVHMIDCTGAMDHAAGTERTVIIDSPTRLEAIAMRLERLCAHAGPDALGIVCSLDGLAMYNGPEMVREFSHYVTNRFRTLGLEGVLVARRGGVMADLVGALSDGVAHLESPAP